MNLNDVQKKLAEKLEVSQTEARKIYDAVVEMITEEVRDSADQDITVPGIVVFSKTAKEARTAKNPATGAPVAGFLAVRASLAVLLKTTIPGTVISWSALSRTSSVIISTTES